MLTIKVLNRLLLKPDFYHIYPAKMATVYTAKRGGQH